MGPPSINDSTPKTGDTSLFDGKRETVTFNIEIEHSPMKQYIIKSYTTVEGLKRGLIGIICRTRNLNKQMYIIRFKNNHLFAFEQFPNANNNDRIC